MGTFFIDATDLAWMGGAADDPRDLCLHGHAKATIGDRTLEYEDATVSATALYLLKSITEDHLSHADNQLLPCCGFFLLPNEALDNVVIVGCDNGVDWSILHDGDFIRLRLDDGYEEIVPLEAYQAEVFRFADKIEAFYAACTPRVLPADEFDRNGYLAFWNEWRRRRGRNGTSVRSAEM